MLSAAADAASRSFHVIVTLRPLLPHLPHPLLFSALPLCTSPSWVLQSPFPVQCLVAAAHSLAATAARLLLPACRRRRRHPESVGPAQAGCSRLLLPPPLCSGHGGGVVPAAARRVCQRGRGQVRWLLWAGGCSPMDFSAGTAGVFRPGTHMLSLAVSNLLPTGSFFHPLLQAAVCVGPGGKGLRSRGPGRCQAPQVCHPATDDVPARGAPRTGALLASCLACVLALLLLLGGPGGLWEQSVACFGCDALLAPPAAPRDAGVPHAHTFLPSSPALLRHAMPCCACCCCCAGG